jgi:gamma-glutamyltranspeptidase / glutathione hydrolase
MCPIIDALSPNLSRERRVFKTALTSEGGVVVSQNRLASEIGARVLKEGGHAADAAVATAFALGVVEPWMSGVGGVGGALVYEARSDRVTAIDFGGRSPAALDPIDFPLANDATDRFARPIVKERRNSVGPRAIVVPGVPAGLYHLHKLFGRKRWDALISPAIRLAEDGLVVDWYVTLILATAFGDLVRDVAARSWFLPGNAPPTPALATASTPIARLPAPVLARTLRALATDGPRTFYRGEVARALSNDIKRMSGYLTEADLASYEVRISAPLEIRYRDRIVHTLPELNGGPTLAKALAALEQRPKGRESTPGAETYLAYASALSTAWRDRLHHMGDSGDRSALTSTTHFCVVDRTGNVVTATMTLLSLFGCRVVSPETGILMNNGIDWFDPRPDRPNSIAPDRRVLANYLPAIMTGGSELVGIGASGGRKILAAVFQLLAMCTDFGFDLARAFHTPRLDVSGGDRIVVDRRMTKEAISALAKDYQVALAEPVVYSYPFAYANAVRCVGGTREAVCDAEHPWSEAVSEDSLL